MSLLFVAIIGVVIIVANQANHDYREGPRSSTHEDVKGDNGPEELITNSVDSSKKLIGDK